MHRKHLGLIKPIIIIDPVVLKSLPFKLPVALKAPIKLLPIQSVLHGLKCDLPVIPFNWFLEFCPKCGTISQSPIREDLIDEDILLFAEIDAYKIHQLTKVPYLCRCGRKLIPRYYIN